MFLMDKQLYKRTLPPSYNYLDALQLFLFVLQKSIQLKKEQVL